MTQVTTVRKIKTHESVMRSHDSLVDLQICWTTAQTLDIDTPLVRFEVEGLESTSLAGQFDGVNMLVSTVVSSTWVTLRVLVGHGGSQGVKDGSGCDIFGGDEDDGLALTLDLEFLDKWQMSMRSMAERRSLLTMISAISGSVSNKDFSSIYTS